MSDGVWIEIDAVAHRANWDVFDTRFKFSPSVSRPGPAIEEPRPSVTFSLDWPAEPSIAAVEARMAAFDALVLYAFTRVIPADRPVIAMDWQHPSYEFWPHRQAIDPQPWEISALPDGDYHIFVSEDFSTGVFGHPWEGTFCVFGEPLVETLAVQLMTILPVVRIDGVPAQVEGLNPFRDTDSLRNRHRFGRPKSTRDER